MQELHALPDRLWPAERRFAKFALHAQAAPSAGGDASRGMAPPPAGGGAPPPNALPQMGQRGAAPFPTMGTGGDPALGPPAAGDDPNGPAAGQLAALRRNPQ